MTKPRYFLAILALAALLANSAGAQTPAAATTSPAMTPDQAQQAIDSLQDPQKRDQLIAVLKAIAAAAPVVAPAPPASSTSTSPPSEVTLKPNGLGVQLLVTLTHWSTRIANEISALADRKSVV
jgi:moderate conductance mechanosensitive channel